MFIQVSFSQNILLKQQVTLFKHIEHLLGPLVQQQDTLNIQPERDANGSQIFVPKPHKTYRLLRQETRTRTKLVRLLLICIHFLETIHLDA